MTDRILIVEDEKLLAESLRTLLTAKGFQVEAVYDGDIAQTVVSRHKGRIWATGKDGINTFFVQLPLH
jgi:DNA-binding response OmpR family regulator